ncbi:MAG: right-handed parallel beta-helix repeat-containing protein [Planctomycetota bacterium]|jgi:parallel beta-helix repeat protein
MLTFASLCVMAAPTVPKPQSTDSQELPVVRVEADDTLVEQSCRLIFPDEPILDANGDGVVHVRGERLTIECEGRLRGSEVGVDPDRYAGIGIVLQGMGHRLVDASASGFKVGILVDGADRSQILNANVSDNFRQRLGSTWEREDPADWLWPHANDEGQWLENYGAGLAVRRSRGVGIKCLWARDVQNGIVLEFCEEASVVGCDCSFLSGWGCALWRASRCRIVANRFDYCVRGYSHGRYNRGQDSAGLLMFEQCSWNLVEANSITHGGDGVFAFAGKEALGEVPGPVGADGEPFNCEGRGCNGNVFTFNDLSHAAAHGLELTFSFDNDIRRNVVEHNAICGLWLGYSRDTRVLGNRFFDNGGAGYGAERGAINAEHAQRTLVLENLFEDNALDVRFWSDADVGLAATPWVRDNGQGATDNWITDNHSHAGLKVELRDVGATIVDLDPSKVDADEASQAFLRRRTWRDVRSTTAPGESSLQAWPLRQDLAGVRESALKRYGLVALSNRGELRGRETIVINEWGPYDWTRPYLQPLETRGALARYRLLGPPGTRLLQVDLVDSDVEVAVQAATAGRPVGPDGLAAGLIEVRPKGSGVPTAYRLNAKVMDAEGAVSEHELLGVLMELAWTTRFARWEQDPRENPEALFAALEAAPAIELRELDLDFGGGGPADVVPDPAPELEVLGRDQFGTWATTTLKLPVGGWLLRTVSDDGLRVQIDGDTVIEDWTWHGPTPHEHYFKVTEEREVRLDVRHFELDGWAQLTVELEPADS